MAEDKKQTVILEFQVDVDQSVTSINKLTAANKELRKERNELNLTTKEGQKRAEEINKQIDKNTATIKNNVSAIEKQKINIGNYKSALDGVSPQLSKFVSGIEGSTKAAWAFIATPIGAVIGALGLAVAAVTAYFKGSEEGQDRLAKISATLAVVTNKLMVAFEAVGEALLDSGGAFDTFTKKFGIFGAALDLSLSPLKLLILGLEKISELTGFDKVVDDAVKAGEAIAKLNDEIESNETALILKRAETNAQVQKLREDAIKQEGKLKAETISEAIRLEKELAELEKQQHKDRLKAFELEAATTGDNTEEQKKQRAELQAAIINAEAAGASATIKLQKELEGLRDKERADREKNIALIQKQAEEQAKASEQERLARIKNLEESEQEVINESLQTEFKVKTDFNQELNDTITKQNEAFRDNEAKSAKTAADMAIINEHRKLDAAVAVAEGLKGFMDEQSAEYKAIATAQTLISTYQTAALAYKAAFLPVATVASPAIGTAFAAAAVLQGLQQVAAINGVEFAEGGVVLRGPSHAEGGIPIVAEGNEIIMTKGVFNNPKLRSQASALNVAGGGRSFADGGYAARSISQPIDQNFDVLNIVKNMPAPVVSVKEINSKQRSVKVKQKISKR
jgi:hypothetical protein